MSSLSLPCMGAFWNFLKIHFNQIKFPSVPARISSIIPSEEITAKVGDTVSFDCIAEGNPPPFVGIKNATELAPGKFFWID